MSSLEYKDPNADVEISGPHRGNIRCRNLVVRATGSIVGNIEASDVRNFGRIRGIVNADDIFINNKDAKFWGNVYAPKLGNHPEGLLEGATSMTRPFDLDSPFGVSSPTALEQAVEEGIRRGIAKYGLSSSDDQGFAVPEPGTPSAEEEVFEQAAQADLATALTDASVAEVVPQRAAAMEIQTAEDEPPAFKWSPPGRSRGEHVPASGQPRVLRALPPLFETAV